MWMGHLIVKQSVSITILTWLLSYFRLYRVDSLLFRSFIAIVGVFLGIYNHVAVTYVFISHLSLLSPSAVLVIYLNWVFVVLFLFSRVLFALILQLLKKIVSKPYTVAIWGFNKTSIELASQLEINSCFIKFIGIINENSSETYETKEDFKLGLSNSIHSFH
jgi:putative colanic acid biosynthesis UDP-glucose lipid carrier transferase